MNTVPTELQMQLVLRLTASSEPDASYYSSVLAMKSGAA